MKMPLCIQGDHEPTTRRILSQSKINTYTTDSLLKRNSAESLFLFYIIYHQQPLHMLKQEFVVPVIGPKPS